MNDPVVLHSGTVPHVLGLDIGGANLKAAHSDGTARLVPFALWKQPDQLEAEVFQITVSMPRFDVLAVTMTGELCDCYESKRQGVQAILDAVELAAGKAAVWVWRNDGRFVDIQTARQTPLQVAAANWLASATYVGRFTPDGPALLIDIGSTTTDIIPLQDGAPMPSGRTDPERLGTGELVYTGVRRTPLCALLGSEGAAELFATTLDVYLILEFIEEHEADCNTADGRPATKAAAHARLARMKCSDLETSTADERLRLALRSSQRQVSLIADRLERVIRRKTGIPRYIVSAGSGAFLIPAILEAKPRLGSVSRIALRDKLGATASDAACAYALAILAQEHADVVR
jgi:probable H4MPT-linked C1 transfer pathway protein